MLLYHADLPIVGSFLGLETFFALSGFLISGLLLAEWQQAGRINLQVFWLRRARRLLPALFFLLAGTLLYADLALRGGLAELRGDALASLAYVMNWRLISGGQSYFDPMVRPSLLQHLWSLAIEEQFYLLWPLIFVAGMRFLRATGLLVAITLAALASTTLVALLYRLGADPSRIYYGTDTRAAGLLLGAALAMIWTRFQVLRTPARRSGLLFDGAGLLALGLAAPVTSAKITRSPLPRPPAPARPPTASPGVETAAVAPPVTAAPADAIADGTIGPGGESAEDLEVLKAPLRTPPMPTPTIIPVDPVPFDPAIVTELQRLLDDTVADGFVPGAVVSVSIPGYVPWNGASGVSNVNRAQAMAPDTLIQAASITKMFTAVTVLQLAEEGIIDLDQPIGTWLPDIVPLANRTTVRHLLSHTSGIVDYLEDRRFFVGAYQNPQRTYTPAELVGMVDQYAAAFEPGTERAWKYSSTNYVILGMLVEQVTGRTLAQEMRRRIMGPLGLTHTFFAPDEPIEGTLAQGYIDDSDRANVSMTFVYGTANIISTAGELRAFTDALFDGRLLSAEMLATMRAVADTGGAYDMPELAYGLGLMSARLNVGPAPDGARRPYEISAVRGHIGGVAGFRSAVWHVPESDITIALSLNQADIDPNLLARDILDTILTWQGR